MSNEAITLHIEMSNEAFAGYIKTSGLPVALLTEEDFQVLTEALAGTAMTADRIVRNFAASVLAKEGGQA